MPVGLRTGCDSDQPGQCGCLHSEENAVINCDSPREVEKHVFVTHHPCVACAKRLINLGNVKKVFYARDYRTSEAMHIFAQVNIELVKLNRDFFDRDSLLGSCAQVVLD